ncbi:hypothetical protein EA438_10140 [Streptococcus dysgalactiae subsp. dysgalactiae]|nr:hypothetical protein [Streptococcus dysgalactiae subsp. dysgalactiae]
MVTDLFLLFIMFNMFEISFLKPRNTLIAPFFLNELHLAKIPAVGGMARNLRNAIKAITSFMGPWPESNPFENLFANCETVDTRFLARFSILKDGRAVFFRWLFIRDLLSNKKLLELR